MKKQQILVRLFAGIAIGLAGYAVYALAPKGKTASRNVTPISHCSLTVSTPDAKAGVESARPGFASYSRTIQESLFTPPQPKRALPAPQKAALPAPLPVVPLAPPVDPLADAVYSGFVTMDGKTTALIESRSTKQGTYVDEGDAWQGFQVLSVSPSEITLMVDGTPRRLAKSDAINLVPLSANAPGSAQGADSRLAGSSQSGPGQNGEVPQSMIMDFQRVQTYRDENISSLKSMKEPGQARGLELEATYDVYSLQNKL